MVLNPQNMWTKDNATTSLMFRSNYLRNESRVLSWYNLGFTQFLIRHAHNKLTIAETQCSQGYQKLVEKLRGGKCLMWVSMFVGKKQEAAWTLNAAMW